MSTFFGVMRYNETYHIGRRLYSFKESITVYQMNAARHKHDVSGGVLIRYTI